MQRGTWCMSWMVTIISCGGVECEVHKCSVQSISCHCQFKYSTGIYGVQCARPGPGSESRSQSARQSSLHGVYHLQHVASLHTLLQRVVVVGSCETLSSLKSLHPARRGSVQRQQPRQHQHPVQFQFILAQNTVMVSLHSLSPALRC